MPSFPVNLGPFACSGGSFRPYGKRITGGSRKVNPKLEAPWSARFVVGFNVGHEQVYDMDALVALVRAELGARPAATFIAQRGLYTHHDPRVGVVDEQGAQVVILDVEGLTEAVFVQKMRRLAKKLCRKMKQESILLEIQKAGVSHAFYSEP